MNVANFNHESNAQNIVKQSSYEGNCFLMEPDPRTEDLKLQESQSTLFVSSVVENLIYNCTSTFMSVTSFGFFNTTGK